MSLESHLRTPISELPDDQKSIFEGFDEERHVLSALCGMEIRRALHTSVEHSDNGNRLRLTISELISAFVDEILQACELCEFSSLELEAREQPESSEAVPREDSCPPPQYPDDSVPVVQYYLCEKVHRLITKNLCEHARAEMERADSIFDEMMTVTPRELTDELRSTFQCIVVCPHIEDYEIELMIGNTTKFRISTLRALLVDMYHQYLQGLQG